MDSLQGKEILQKMWVGLEGWAVTKHMKFDKSKCQILHLGQVILLVHTNQRMTAWRTACGKTSEDSGQ